MVQATPTPLARTAVGLSTTLGDWGDGCFEDRNPAPQAPGDYILCGGFW